MTGRRWRHGGRARIVAGIALAGVVAALMTGCAAEAPYGADEYAAEMDVARQFMAALEDGSTATALKLTTGDLGIPLDATTDVFYESAEARPAHAKIVSAVATSDTVVHVDVDFQLAGDDRDIALAFTRGQASPRISGWLFQGLEIAPHPTGGSIEISDRVKLPLGRDSVQIALLPGRYSFRYDGDGRAAGKRFSVDFPYHSQQLEPNLPAGMSIPYSGLTIDEPD